MLAEPIDRAPYSLGSADAGRHRQFEPEMGNAVEHGAGQRRPRDRSGGSPEGFGERPRGSAPGGRRELGHAAQQTIFRTAAKQHRAIRSSEPERDAVAQRPLWLRRPRRQILRFARCRGGATAPRHPPG